MRRANAHCLSLDELVKIWRAAEALQQPYRDAVKLIITTGQRRNEVGAMRWGEIDLVHELWTLPPGRTKKRRQHTVPLPGLAIDILRARRAALRHAPSPERSD